MTREEKQKAIDALKISVPINALTQEEFNDYIQTLNKIMDWLEQEPFINKPCVSQKTCEHDKNIVLDKIRAEIEQRPYGIANDSVIQGMKYERADILEIIDKYKAESEYT